MRNKIMFQATALSFIITWCLFLSSCQKSMTAKQDETSAEASESVSSTLTGKSTNLIISPREVVGDYDVRGSRTVYFGQANKDGSNVYLHLDYRADKKVNPSPDNKSLTCSYGDSKYVTQGWKYIIRYDKKKSIVTLSPNDIMAAAIVPNSFETREATYNPRTKVFSFRTRFTSPEDGNEAEIFEVLTAQ